MALLEAMAVECKIIAARNTAIVEVVGLEGAGIFFETSNELDLVEKMMNSLNDNDIQYKVQQNKQIDNFTVATMGNQIDKIYKSVI
jgi:glycosyltransferase involved in cell wall biosynthesis